MKRNLIFFGMLMSLLNIGYAKDTSMSEENLLKQTLKFARGHDQFKNLYFKQQENQFIKLVKEGQNPQTLFISCSDSRIIPDLILSTKPGDLFAIRNAGNFVPSRLWKSK